MSWHKLGAHTGNTDPLGLDPAQLDAELQVLLGPLELPRDCGWISNPVVDSLPG